jgi:Spy/CpxP family protein refolding chaperone
MTKKTWMAALVAGAMGLAAMLTPALAWSQEAKCPGAAARGDGGPGMGMKGHGGHGMMGGELGLGPIWRLDLTEAQRTQLTKLQTDYRRDNWGTLGKLLDARTSLRDLEHAAQPDAKKVGAAYAEVSKLEQSLLEARVQAGNQARAALTDAQRSQLDQWRQQGGNHAGGPDAHGRAPRHGR